MNNADLITDLTICKQKLEGLLACTPVERCAVGHELGRAIAAIDRAIEIIDGWE